MTAVTPGQRARDPQAEIDHAEWAGWHEAQGYERDTDEADLSAESFFAGMQAARDLDAATLAAEIRAGHVRIETGHAAIAAREPLTVKPSDDVKAAPELAAAMAESRHYRQALQVIAGYAAGTATKQQIAIAARRALEGK